MKKHASFVALAAAVVLIAAATGGAYPYSVTGPILASGGGSPFGPG
jgi:hypothetical protein